MDLAAILAPDRIGAMFMLGYNKSFQLHLLHYARRQVQELHIGIAALGAGAEAIIMEGVDILLRKRRTFMFRVSWLCANLGLGLARSLGLGLCDVRGGRLAGIRRVLRKPSHRALQCVYFFS